MSPAAKDTLKVCVLSLDIAWGDVDANIARAGRLLDELPADCDVAVLPELFTTAFIQDAEALPRVAERSQTLAIDNIRRWCRERGVMIAGSFLACDGSRRNFYNRGFMAVPGDESLHCYDKRHLFSLSSESRLYTQGDAPLPAVQYKGWKIALMVCYDLRFPVWARNYRHYYDMMLVPANWPQVRRYAWDHLLIARAIENQAVYVGANRSGSDDYGHYDGLSAIYNAMGQPVGMPSADEPAIITAVVSLEEIAAARRRLPVIDSADDFRIFFDEIDKN